MLPEFKRGCIIVIDPTGRATDGSFVLARNPVAAQDSDTVDDFTFRQLRKRGPDQWQLRALNEESLIEPVNVELEEVVGVIVQRAGARRSYHKHYT